jgi:hypothetical protein
VLDRFVEGEHDAGVALHLSVCPACRTEHDGLLALIEHERTRHDDLVVDG